MAYEFFKQLTEGKIHKHMDFQGMDISVEIPAGGKRTGTNKHTGEQWEMPIADAYGYIKGTHSPDGEHLDCYVRKSPDKEAKVYVMHQLTIDGSKFDEDKVMLGYSNASEAKKAFKNYTFKPAVMFGGMTEFELDHFLVVAFQASKSKAMLTDEETFEDFAKRGLIPSGVHSPVEVARRVSEDIEVTMDSNQTPSVRDIAARLAALNERQDPYGLVEFAQSGEPEDSGSEQNRFVTCDWGYVSFIEMCKEHLGWTFRYIDGHPALTKDGMVIHDMREYDGYSEEAGHAFNYTAFSVSGEIDEPELAELLAGFECSVADLNETLMSVNPPAKRRKGGFVGGWPMGWYGHHDHEDDQDGGDAGADMGGGDGGGGMGESIANDRVSSAAWADRAKHYAKQGHRALAAFARSRALLQRQHAAATPAPVKPIQDEDIEESDNPSRDYHVRMKHIDDQYVNAWADKPEPPCTCDEYQLAQVGCGCDQEAWRYAQLVLDVRAKHPEWFKKDENDL